MNITPLRPGDIIDVIAPSGGFDPQLITEIEEFILFLGLVPRIPEDLLQPGEDPFAASSFTTRSAQIIAAFYASDSKAVWCAKGGYGAAELIPTLGLLPIPAQPKLLMGFSDITALHLFVGQKWAWPSLHSKLLVQFCSRYHNEELGKSHIAAATTEIKQVLFGEQTILKFTKLTPLNALAKTNQILHSTITGGNLCLLQTSIGTAWQLQAGNKIIFIEDVDERGYKIDRMLLHLRQSQLLAHAVAIIFGDFTRGLEVNGQSLVPQALQRFADAMDIPVLQLTGIGHDHINHPLPLGTKAQLCLGKVPTLECNLWI
jgi:muramoyltetrapeptide carboxypeptidase